MKLVIDDIMKPGPEAKARLPWIALGMFVVFYGISRIVIGKNRRIRLLWQFIERALPLTCGEKLLRLPLSYHHTEHSETLVSKIVKGTGRIMDICGLMAFEIIPLFIQTLVAAAIITLVEWRATLILLPVVGAFLFLTTRLKHRLAPLRRQRHDVDSDADMELGQAVANVMTVQAFAQETSELARIAEKRQRVWDLAQEEYDSAERSEPYRNMLVSLGRVLTITVCAYAVYDARMTIGTLAFIVALTDRIFVSCYRVNAIFDRVSEAMEPVRKMTDLLAEPVKVENPPDPVPVPNGRFHGDVAFQGLTYRYPVRQQSGTPQPMALSEVTHAIPSGSMEGIPGPSGGGKSTLARLLFRFDDPTSGSITIDGIDIRRMRLDAFRRQIGYVPQEVEIFDRTVAENIAYGCPDASREDIIRAAKVANAHEFIMSLEHGYDTLVGNRGLRLSGGQRQRIGIARAVLLDPPILVLDEATSHVDVVSEQKIQRAIDGLRKDRTILLIAHRLSTLHGADGIMVLENGRVAETGTHEQLLRQNGIYHRLVKIQEQVAEVS